MIDLRRPGQRSFGEGFIEEETADQVLDKRAIIRPEGSADSGATANSDPHRNLRERYSAAAGSAGVCPTCARRSRGPRPARRTSTPTGSPPGRRPACVTATRAELAVVTATRIVFRYGAGWRFLC
jgi:hypothetical protein